MEEWKGTSRRGGGVMGEDKRKGKVRGRGKE